MPVSPNQHEKKAMAEAHGNVFNKRTKVMVNLGTQLLCETGHLLSAHTNLKQHVSHTHSHLSNRFRCCSTECSPVFQGANRHKSSLPDSVWPELNKTLISTTDSTCVYTATPQNGFCGKGLLPEWRKVCQTRDTAPPAASYSALRVPTNTQLCHMNAARPP